MRLKLQGVPNIWKRNFFLNPDSWQIRTELPNRMTIGASTNCDLSAQQPEPARGDLGFFDGAPHVSFATGNGKKGALLFGHHQIQHLQQVVL